jgi:hypothetical protein
VNKRSAALAAMVALFVVFLIWATYTFFTKPYPGAVDFRQRWSAIHDFWHLGLNPYSAEVTERTELGIFGHRADHDKNENPGDFIYPMYTAIILGPLGVPDDYALAEAIWLVLIGVLLVLCFRAMIDLFSWRPPGWLLIVGMIWAVVFYPGLRGLLLGQPGTFVACLILLAIWSLARGHDVLAGLILAISLIKPTVGFLIIPFLGLWALRYQRWRFVISLVGISAALLIGSFILLPTWLTDWLNQVKAYPSYTDIGSPVWIIVGPVLEPVISGALLILMLWAWWRTLWRKDASTLDWTIALTLTITMLIAPRTATPPHFVVFMMVLIFYFRQITRRNPKLGPLAIIAIMLITSIGLWWLFLSTLLPFRVEHPINYLPLPIISLALLLIDYRSWWQSRPGFRELSV